MSKVIILPTAYRERRDRIRMAALAARERDRATARAIRHQLDVDAAALAVMLAEAVR